MSESDIPVEVEYLIHHCIDSVVLLEVLLFLRSSADRGWSPTEVSSTLSISESWTAERLKRLKEKGLLVRESEAPERYCYVPMTRELARTVDSLAVAYKERRIAITKIIVARLAQE